MCLIEKPLCMQLLLELLKGKRECSRTLRCQRIHIELIGPVALVDRHTAARDDLHSILGRETQAACITVEHDTFHARARILERKITMPRGIALEIGHLAANQEIGEDRLPFEHALDVACDIADRMNGHKVPFRTEDH